jgi:hypothetical protein
MVPAPASQPTQLASPRRKFLIFKEQHQMTASNHSQQLSEHQQYQPEPLRNNVMNTESGKAEQEHFGESSHQNLNNSMASSNLNESFVSGNGSLSQKRSRRKIFKTPNPLSPSKSATSLNSIPPPDILISAPMEMPIQQSEDAPMQDPMNDIISNHGMNGEMNVSSG